MRDRDYLKALIQEKSYREGEFLLSSGKPSSYYIDLKPAALDPKGAVWIGKLFMEWISGQSFRVDGVAGLTLGADPVLMAITIASAGTSTPLPSVIVRKEAKKHGTGQYLEGAQVFGPGAKFLVVEDVVTTGASAQKAIERLQDAGFEVVGVITVVDREEGGALHFQEQGLAFFSLYKISQFRQKP